MMGVVEELLSFPKFTDTSALDQFDALYKPRDIDAIRIVGSNGKGSTARMTAAILKACGLKTGLYTSPHMLRFHERIEVDGVEISEEALEDGLAFFRHTLLHQKTCAAALYTAMACRYFDQQGVEAAVFEAGLGGRLDPVRQIPGKPVAMTSIDLEHTQVLGDTVEHIAIEKLQLCQSGCTLYSGPNVPQAALAQGLADLDVHHVPFLDNMTLSNVGYLDRKMSFDLTLDGEAYPSLALSLPGRHQVENAILAIRLAKQWLSTHHPDRLPDFPQAVRQALASITIPGRFERLSDDPALWIDAAHTPDGIMRLCETIDLVISEKPFVLVCAGSMDKDLENMLPPLIRRARHVICTEAKERAAPVARIAQITRAEGIPGDVIHDLGRALDIARSEGDPVVVAGGLFLALEARKLLISP